MYFSNALEAPADTVFADTRPVTHSTACITTLLQASASAMWQLGDIGRETLVTQHPGSRTMVLMGCHFVVREDGRATLEHIHVTAVPHSDPSDGLVETGWCDRQSTRSPGWSREQAG